MESDVDDSDLDVDSNQDDILKSIIISPPFPISPPISLDFNLDFESESNSQDLNCMDDQDRPYWHLLSEIMALIDKVERAWFLNCLNVPLLHVLQLHLLKYFAVFWPYLFHRKLHVNSAVFNYMVNKICELEIFNSGLNHLQLPVSIQLAIFFNHVGHYTVGMQSPWKMCHNGQVLA